MSEIKTREDFERIFNSKSIEIDNTKIEESLEDKKFDQKFKEQDILKRTSNSETIQEKRNPLTEKLRRIPGETFRLPTRGVFYTNGEISDEVQDGEVVVFPLTGYEELMLKSPDMLFQGTAIENVIKKCVPSIIKPLELSANDMEFLLTCIRKVTNGEFIKIFYKCEHEKNETPIEERVEKEYDISIMPFIKGVKEIRSDDINRLTFPLGDLFAVTIKPMRMKDVLDIRRSSIPKYENLLEATYASHVKIIASMIKEVDGISDQELIVDWIYELPNNLRDELLNKIDVLNNWGISFDCKFKCKDCGTEVIKPQSINPIDFFLRPSSLTIL